MVPLPAVPHLLLPGLALADARKSWNVFAGKVGKAVTTIETLAKVDTVTKSFAGS
jgi:hypothetical protein